MTADLVKRLRAICDPTSEAMPDGTRLTMFVRAGDEAATTLETLSSELERVKGERDALAEALTPSAETKAAYIGEFAFNVDTVGIDEDGEPVDCTRRVTVPWTTIKEIMAAIRARAALASIQAKGA